jgi:hypothetical protein
LAIEEKRLRNAMGVGPHSYLLLADRYLVDSSSGFSLSRQLTSLPTFLYEESMNPAFSRKRFALLCHYRKNHLAYTKTT